MLSADRISVSYGRVAVLHEVSLGVGRGELVALLGANGAGKTTTLRALSGLIPTASGEISLDQRDLTASPAQVFADAGIAHIPEGRGTFGRLSVEQNLLMGLYPRRRQRPDRRAELERVLGLFGVLASRRSQRAGSLSGGEQQMLAVGRALISSPEILLIDEPSHGLAPQVVDELFELLDRLRGDGVGILVVEQQVSRALAAADRAYVLERGRVTYEGPSAPLLADRDRLARSYLGGVR